MSTYVNLRLPWFVSMPAFVAAAIVLAIVANALAGVYFERTTLNDIDPFAGLKLVTASVASTEASVVTPAPVVADQSAAASTPDPAPLPATAPAAAAPPTGPVLLSEGTFVDGDPGHNGEGTARLIRDVDGSHILRFEDFSVTNGPDLFVILSTDPAGSRGSAAAADALNLGRLRATDGNINYAVPDGVDLSIYRSVVIYCRAFRVVFAVATLEAP